jgi:hypothetical protein
MSSDSKPIPPPEPTALGDLSYYAPRQTKLIESNPYRGIRGPLLRDTNHGNWKLLWTSIWGVKDPDALDATQEVSRGTGSDAVDDELAFPDGAPTHCNVMTKPGVLDHCWNFKCEKIFVRSEYKEAEDFIVSVCGKAQTPPCALVVTGQPGIGLHFLHSAVIGS